MLVKLSIVLLVLFLLHKLTIDLAIKPIKKFIFLNRMEEYLALYAVYKIEQGNMEPDFYINFIKRYAKKKWGIVIKKDMQIIAKKSNHSLNEIIFFHINNRIVPKITVFDKRYRYLGELANLNILLRIAEKHKEEIESKSVSFPNMQKS